jgi:hypothetical protein
MTQQPDNPHKPDRNSAREERLAQALRENLKRRKAQARARKVDENGPGASTDDPSPQDKEPA